MVSTLQSAQLPSNGDCQRLHKVKLKGFTLIELLVAMAIFGILARIAYGSYVESVNRAKRSQAQVALLSAAQTMERFFTNNNTYATATIGTASTSTILSTVPAAGTGIQTYTLSFLRKPLPLTPL